MAKDEIYLIDGNAYIHRAYHAIAVLNNSAGQATNAIYGFTNIIRRILREREPKMLAVAFDTKGPVFRHRLYPEYKANRSAMPEDLVSQVPYVKKITQAYNILTMEHDDQEADDLIAAAARHFSEQGHKVIIVSGDKDLLQLVTDTVSLWDPMKNKTMDPEAIKQQYGVDPEQLLDYFALTGDSSDNIPGVPGVGPKTAQKLISEWGSLERFYQEGAPAMKKSKTKERILDNRDNAFLSRDLVRLNHEAPIPEKIEEYRLREPNAEDLSALFRELEFHSLLKEEFPDQVEPPPTLDEIDTQKFHLIQTPEQLNELVGEIAGAPHLVIDTETTSTDQLSAELVGISLCVDLQKAWYIPLAHLDGEGRPLPEQLARDSVLAALAPFLQDPDLPKIGHNLKYDWTVLTAERNGAARLAGPLYDTMIGAWLLEPERRSYKLDDLCAAINLKMTPFLEVTGGDNSDHAFARVEPRAACDYSCEDVYGALRLFEHQQPLLREKELWSLFTELECPLIPVLAEMERTGIAVDYELAANLSEEFGLRLKELEQDIYRAGGEEFNINSPRQLAHILFEKLNLPKGRKTKTGYSTDIKVLEKLSKRHALPALILSFRTLAKLKSTYVDNLTKLTRKDSGRVHTSFNQCGTVTGRLSSSRPNLQNIPIRDKEGRRIRSAFIAPPGHVLISGDYSQVDLRVLAHYSQDPALLQAFRADKDIHARTAAEIFRVMPQLITPEMRRVAKTINFGIVYGMSSFGLAGQLNVSRKEAQVFIDRYFEHYQGVKIFMQTIAEQAGRDGYVTTLLGRRRLLPDITSKNRTKREFAERAAINTPIQGTAADIIKLAMLKVDHELRERKLASRMILQIHDELVLETPEQEVETVMDLLRQCMENVMQLDVPLIAAPHVGKSLDKV